MSVLVCCCSVLLQGSEYDIRGSGGLGLSVPPAPKTGEPKGANVLLPSAHFLCWELCGRSPGPWIDVWPLSPCIHPYFYRVARAHVPLALHCSTHQYIYIYIYIHIDIFIYIYIHIYIYITYCLYMLLIYIYIYTQIVHIICP